MPAQSEKSDIVEENPSGKDYPKSSYLSKPLVEDACKIAAAVVKEGIAHMRLDNRDPEHASTRYSGPIKPLLDRFKTVYGHAPQQFFQFALLRAAQRYNLGSDFSTQGFKIAARTINPYSWAATFRTGETDEDYPITRHPQLYILANDEGLECGFSYGKNVEQESPCVDAFRSNIAVRKMVMGILADHPEIGFHSIRDPDRLAPPDDIIAQRMKEGDFGEWTKNSALFVSWESGDIPVDIDSAIQTELDRIIPIFLAASYADDLEELTAILRRYGDNTPPAVAFPDRRWADVRDSLARPITLTELRFEKLHFPEEEKRRLSASILGALKAGKHIILIGPPGSGKSKIAEAVCREIVGAKNLGNYGMCTASADWSVYETIGGYRPDLDGTLKFHPGIFLRSFQHEGEPANRWLIIDEINRADIDKAFGSLFSALSDDDVDLTFDMGGRPVRLIGRPEPGTEVKPNHFIIHPDWRIIATMNTYDKSALYEMSYAFMRRFAFIMVDVPKSVDAPMMHRYLDAWGVDGDGSPVTESFVADLAALWTFINGYRRIGPALIHDILEYSLQSPEFSLEDSVGMYLFPQLEGLDEDTVVKLLRDLIEQPFIGDLGRLSELAAGFFGVNPDRIG